MKKLYQIIIGGCALLAVSAATAKADNIPFSYTGIYNGESITASGDLTLVANGSGSYTATSGYVDVTGAGYPFAGDYSLYANTGAPGATYSPSGHFIFDDLVYLANNAPNTGGGFIDTDGLLFSGNGIEINIWGNGGLSYTYDDNKLGDPITTTGTFTVPDGGSTVALLGLALGACGLIARRQKLA